MYDHTSENKKALIAMSGGVDSSVAALLAQQAGYDCIGCTMRLFGSDIFASPGSAAGNDAVENCTVSNSAAESSAAGKDVSENSADDARRVAERLGMPFHVFHYEESFRENVIEPFVRCYMSGMTPNPCVDCNRGLKFGRLFDEMLSLGCDVLVTGHYARICFDNTSGRWLLKRAADLSKDQSYVLYVLSQHQLEHTLFPLGELEKTRTREIAGDHGLVTAKKHDSQDICFVPDGDYTGFIERQSGGPGKQGHFIDREGNVIGSHKGITHYTLGQRRGLGIPSTGRLYVTDIDPESGNVTLGENSDLFGRELTACRINLISVERIEGEMRVSAKIRYRHAAQPAVVTQTGDDEIHVTFDEPQRAITPGQSVVLYDGDVVVGGGVITRRI